MIHRHIREPVATSYREPLIQTETNQPNASNKQTTTPDIPRISVARFSLGLETYGNSVWAK